MRFSLRLNNDVDPTLLREVAVVAERQGFDQLWVSNDLFLRSASVLLGALAVQTERLHLGVGVFNATSMHTSEIAMAAATLQELSGGRFLLGLGAGAEEFLAWAGIPRPRPLARTREAVEACRALLDRGRPSDDAALHEAGWGPGGPRGGPGPRGPVPPG